MAATERRVAGATAVADPITSVKRQGAAIAAAAGTP
jgi:hypothetical protein